MLLKRNWSIEFLEIITFISIICIVNIIITIIIVVISIMNTHSFEFNLMLRFEGPQ